MSFLIDILAVEVLGVKNSIVKRGRKGLGSFIGLVFYLGFGVAVGFGASRLFTWLHGMLSDYPLLLGAIEANILSGATIGAFILMLMSGMKYTYEKLFESGDTAFLLSNPIPARTVFGSKFLISYGFNWLMGFSVGLSTYYGYAHATGQPLIYLTALLGYSLAALMFHSIVSLVLLMIMRYLPTKTLKQVFIVLTAGLGIGIVLFSQLMSSRLGEGIGSEMDVIERLGMGNLWGFDFLPHTWVLKASLIPEGGLVPGLVAGLVPLVLVSGLLVLVTIMVSERTFLAGWGSAG